MDQKESPCQSGIAVPQIKTEPGTSFAAPTIKTEPGLPLPPSGAVTVKQEPSTTSREDDKRISRLLQEYRPQPPGRGRVVRRYAAASRKLRYAIECGREFHVNDVRFGLSGHCSCMKLGENLKYTRFWLYGLRIICLFRYLVNFWVVQISLSLVKFLNIR